MLIAIGLGLLATAVVAPTCVYFHRMAMNESLQKESKKLKQDIRQAKKRYDNALIQCNLEINDRNEQYKEQLLEIQQDLNDKLNNDVNFLNEITNHIIEYAGYKLSYDLQRKKKAAVGADIKLHNETMAFYKKKIECLNQEITQLEQRKLILEKRMDISYLVQMLKNNGIDHLDDETPKGLMEKLRPLSDGREESMAFQKLRSILEEKSEFGEEIQSINWTITQYKKDNRENAAAKQQAYTEREKLFEEQHKIQEEIEDATAEQSRVRKKIQSYWNPYISEYTEQMDANKKKLKVLFEEISDCKSEQQRVKVKLSALRSNDDWQLREYGYSMGDDGIGDEITRLKRRRSSLSDTYDDLQRKIDRLKREQQRLYDERNTYFERKHMIEAICEENGVPLVLKRSKKYEG